ncbi:hypothetical protein FA15DRAFT_658635 [Coprinopsis marcescibilis]|uniref:Uncharacterized protein n=1 Tax=Coprinopsis marcescibilis TaxID=230819 RepID=A0A5C3KLJ4_COPMA|nr:hypothetical protein FA15DRAFT_658635 [Coprinopsis marcescibilis]
MYPSPTTANGTPLPVIKYTGYLGHDGSPFVTVPNLGERNTALYTGTLEDKPVLIKFAPCYNKEAHTLLANANLAPGLRVVFTEGLNSIFPPKYNAGTKPHGKAALTP